MATIPTTPATPADSPNKMTPCLRILFTASIFLGYAAFGFGDALTGPALMDLATITHSSFDVVSMGLVIRTVAKGSGGVLIGWLYRHANRQIGVIVCLLGCAIVIPIIPYNKSVDTYIASEGVLGLLTGGIDCAAHSWIMELWPGSGALMQTLHFFFSFGMVIAPLVEAPFLSSVVPYSGIGITGDNVTVSGSESRIHIPYAIASGIYLTSAVFACCLCCYARYEAEEKCESEDCPQTRETGRTNNSILVSIVATATKGLAMLLFFSYAISEMNLLSFISGYAVYSDLRLSKATAAFMASVLSASYTVFRAASSVIASKVPTTIMLYACVSLIGIGNACLIFWGDTSETGLWVAIVILGAGHSSINALLYTFLRERMEMTSLICGCCMMSSCIGDMISAVVVGHLLESRSTIFGLVNIAGLSAVVSLLTIFLFLDRLKKRSDAASPPDVVPNTGRSKKLSE